MGKGGQALIEDDPNGTDPYSDAFGAYVDVPPVGSAVYLRDLVDDGAKLNGTVGICNGPQNGATGGCPIVVEIDGELRQAELHPTNLAPAKRDCAPKWYQVPKCGCGAAHTPLCPPRCLNDPFEEPKLTWRILSIPIAITVLFVLLVVYSRDRVLAENDLRAQFRAARALTDHDEL